MKISKAVCKHCRAKFEDFTSFLPSWGEAYPGDPGEDGTHFEHHSAWWLKFECGRTIEFGTDDHSGQPIDTNPCPQVTT